MGEFRGTIAAVTGAASGIGLGLVRALAAEGMRVQLIDLPGSRLDEAAASVHGSVAFGADVSDPKAMIAAAEDCIGRLGPAAVVCANAGIAGPAGLHLWEVPNEAWQRVLDVDLFGVINTLRAYIPPMLANGGGHLMITSSMAGVTRAPAIPAYFAAKHAVVSVAEMLQQQVERDGLPVEVSLLLPSRVDTNLSESHEPGFAASMAQDRKLAQTAGSAAPRVLSSEEVAERAVRGMRAGEFYLFTHRESKARVDAVYLDMCDGFAALATTKDTQDN